MKKIILLTLFLCFPKSCIKAGDSFDSMTDFFSFMLEEGGVERELSNSLNVSSKESMNLDSKETIPKKHKLKIKKEDFDRYVNKYYPRVFVIRDQFFSKMTPEQIAENLQEIVDILSSKTWFYFKNEAEHFDITQYWEFILDQLAFFAFYLERAKFDKEKNIVTFNEISTFGYLPWFSRGNGIKSKQLLKKYWIEKGIKVHHDFYALCFDYLVKLFNEGILIRDWVQVSYYHYELKDIYERMIGTIYESEYQEHLKTCSELANLLKSDLGLNNSSGNEYIDEVSEFYNL